MKYLLLSLLFALNFSHASTSALASESADLATEQDSLAFRLQSLKTATRSIRIQTLIFTGDEVGLRVAELLKQKHEQGVNVKVIVDAVSNVSVRTQIMYLDLLSNGIEIEGYEPSLMVLVNEFNPINPLQTNMRYHEKMWVVDAELPTGSAIIGGLNIANEYFQVSKKSNRIWRDQDVALRGNIIKDIAKAFDSNWEKFKKDKKDKTPLFNPDTYRKLVKLFPMGSGASYSDDNPLGDVHGKDFLDEDIIKKVMEVENKPLNLEFEESPMEFIQSRPRMNEKFINDRYLREIRNAKESIYIVNAYFVPTTELQKALRESSAKRRIPTYVLTNSPETNDLPLITYTARVFYWKLFGQSLDEQLNNTNLNLYEWQGHLHNMGTMHAKFAVFDHRRVIVGSFNLDPRSRNLNSECVVYIENQNLAKKLTDRLFNQDLPKSQAINFKRSIEFITTDSKTKSQAAIGLPLIENF